MSDFVLNFNMESATPDEVIAMIAFLEGREMSDEEMDSIWKWLEVEE